MKSSILAGMAYFAYVFGAGVVLGAIRVYLLVPALGETIGVILELPVMLAWSWLICGWILRQIAVPPGRGARFVMGGTAFVLLMGVELLVAVLLGGLSMQAWHAQFRETAGLLGLLAQVAFAAIPLLR